MYTSIDHQLMSHEDAVSAALEHHVSDYLLRLEMAQIVHESIMESVGHWASSYPNAQNLKVEMVDETTVELTCTFPVPLPYINLTLIIPEELCKAT